VDSFFKNIQNIDSIDLAIEELSSVIELTPNLEKALSFCIKAHSGQTRKSGEPYVIHPILVGAITAYYSNDEAMVIAALLHDIVEDTDYDLKYIQQNYGDDIAHMVDGLTKIVEIREHELIPSSSNEKILSSALSFRKMLLASIDDVRVLVVKLCDRVHNVLTLNALSREKQLRISEETLVVYSPIAHRLGIASLKNLLEDKAFYYIYPKEYKQIDEYLKTYQQKIQLTFNKFISDTKKLLERNGCNPNKFKIISRIKHHYSIYLKMQRKGVSIDEVLDLFAIRVLVENEIDCYKVLGIMHLEYKPLIARFKDYVSTPKENGYQTIHTTVFHNAKIYEIQIRTFDMHNVAEYGVAAHWKYKNAGGHSPNLNWLKSLEFSNENVEEFYSDAKQNLFSEDIVIYSPKGDTYTMPRGATAFDFAYAIHSDVGNCAVEAYVNKVKKPLLTELRSSDIVSIKTTDYPIPRCSWIDMVKTTRAKKSIKILCASRLKEIDELSGQNIVDTIFSRYTKNISSDMTLKPLHKVPHVLDFLKNIKRKIEKDIYKQKGLVARLKVQNLKFKANKFDNILIYSNFSINSVSFDHCCHPKFGDDIVAFKEGNKAIIHHKMCDKAYGYIKTKHNMLFCQWVEDKVYNYKMVVSLPNQRGEMAKLLMYLFKIDANILFIEYGKDKHSLVQYCDIEFDINNANKEEVKALVEKQAKIIDFFSASDAYR